MISFLNKKYAQLGDPTFFRLAPVLCFLSDILVFYYVINKQLPKMLGAKTVKFAITMQNASVARNMTQTDFEDISLLMQNQIAFALSLFLVFHVIIYSLAAFKKKWPLKYISNYTFFGVILTVIEVLMIFFQKGTISPYTFVSLLGYGFVYFGYKYFRKLER